MSGFSPVPRLGLVREVVQSFQKATGLPLQLHQPGEYHVGENEAIPPFCRLLAPSSRACERCIQTHLGLQDPKGLEPRTVVCFAGLTSSAVPVRAGGSLVGFFHTGHASVERPARCAEPGKNCRLSSRGSRSGCAGACHRTPQITRARYEGAVDLLCFLARQVATAPEHNVSANQYPAVDRAMEILRSDATRAWTLKEVSRRVGMHPGYFSERFHQCSGVTFGDFLAGLRVDRARHLLEFTSLSISDVAFSSGFRSLSQFNRTFKKFTGHSPTALRDLGFRKVTSPDTACNLAGSPVVR